MTDIFVSVSPVEACSVIACVYDALVSLLSFVAMPIVHKIMTEFGGENHMEMIFTSFMFSAIFRVIITAFCC